MQSVSALQIGIRYLTLESDENQYTFIRYFLDSGKFYAFVTTVTSSQIERGRTYSELFFNSITLDQQ